MIASHKFSPFSQVENCSNFTLRLLRREIKIIKIGMIYKIMSVVPTVLTRDEFVFFGLSFIIVL
jgi:hypothetical protein